VILRDTGRRLSLVRLNKVRFTRVVVENDSVRARHFPARKWIKIAVHVARVVVDDGGTCTRLGVGVLRPTRREGDRLRQQRHRRDHHDGRDSQQRVQPSASRYRACSLCRATYLHSSSNLPTLVLQPRHGELLSAGDLYRMHHTLPSEISYPPNVPFFTNANGLVLAMVRAQSTSSRSTLPTAAERTYSPTS
jgi:hypothetical protein